MKVTEEQKEEIIIKLAELYDEQLTLPINSIKNGYAEALKLVSRELSLRLSKYSQASFLDINHYIDVPYLYKSVDGCKIRFVLNPNLNQSIYVEFPLGKSGIPCYLLACVANNGCIDFTDAIPVKNVISAVCGLSDYTTIREFVNGNYETHPERIIIFKQFLENGFGELFEEMAKAADMFAKMVYERSKTCDELEDNNTRMLLNEFGMNSVSEKRKRTMFEVHIIKKEIEE